MSKNMTKTQFINSYRLGALKRGESPRSVNRTASMLARTLRDEVVVTR